jgi:hypothetical protein
MKKFLLAAAMLFAANDGIAADSAVVRPYESASSYVTTTPLDYLVLAAQKKRGVAPANPCSDEVFVRRAYLDAIGTLPEPKEVRAFLADRRGGKRAALVDALFEREEFADYWAMKWCDVLRVKSEFPINLWPNAAQAYHRWIRDAVRENRPYDRFARDLLTSSGSNFRVPAVNFYRGIQGRAPADVAAAVALTFMGERIEKWPDVRRLTMARFFSRITWKKTGEWKEEIVAADPEPVDPLDTFFPDGTAVRIASDDDPRRVFADWLVDPRNRWFARAIVNRAWSWFFGRGIVHEPDDMRPDNPAAIPELLAYLEKELVGAHYDLRHLFRLILNSRTYQQSPIPQCDVASAEAMFACYPVRRLDAEVLIDALSWLAGSGESYSSTIPEPFTFLPADRRTITLPDGSITSPFLEMFGRPARDTGLESERNNQTTDAQCLHLLNSTDVQRRIERSPRLRGVVAAARGSVPDLIAQTYMTILSRDPTDAESAAAAAYLRVPGRVGTDLAWALINSKEFLFRH